MTIKLTFTGFDELMKDIQDAGGKIDKAADSATKASAQVMQAHLKQAMSEAGVKSSLTNRMPQFTVEHTGTRVTARVGYKQAAYNERNPSDYHKAIFLNYGTPHRSKHGKVAPRGFIQKAKRRAKSRIKKEQQAALDKILARLKK